MGERHSQLWRWADVKAIPYSEIADNLLSALLKMQGLGMWVLVLEYTGSGITTTAKVIAKDESEALDKFVEGDYYSYVGYKE